MRGILVALAMLLEGCLAFTWMPAQPGTVRHAVLVSTLAPSAQRQSETRWKMSLQTSMAVAKVNIVKSACIV
jgi:hypothetical protein